MKGAIYKHCAYPALPCDSSQNSLIVNTETTHLHLFLGFSMNYGMLIGAVTLIKGHFNYKRVILTNKFYLSVHSAPRTPLSEEERHSWMIACWSDRQTRPRPSPIVPSN